MKLYNQKGKWGSVISFDDLAEIANSVKTEKDDFTIELESELEDINIEVSAADDVLCLEVLVYKGPSIIPEKKRVEPKDLSSFVLDLAESMDIKVTSRNRN